MRAFITGVAGTALTGGERQFFKETQPWGLILFKRNIETPNSVRRLIGEFRAAVGRQAPVLVDQVAKGEVKLADAGEQREVTILFADILLPLEPMGAPFEFAKGSSRP